MNRWTYWFLIALVEMSPVLNLFMKTGVTFRARTQLKFPL